MPSPWTRTAGVALASALLGSAAVWGAAPAAAETPVPRPASFTSAYTVSISPDTVVDSSGQAVAGQAGASGTVDLLVDAERDIVCWDMDVRGLQGSIEGAAKSGVAIREAPASYDGPARVAVPAPEGAGDQRTGEGCVEGPFTTGVVGADGRDTGAGFSLADLEADPAAYAVDVRTGAYPEGAIRGQLVRVPVAGLDTGAGGLALPAMSGQWSTTSQVAALVSLGAAGLAGAITWRRVRLS